DGNSFAPLEARQDGGDARFLELVDGVDGRDGVGGDAELGVLGATEPAAVRALEGLDHEHVGDRQVFLAGHRRHTCRPAASPRFPKAETAQQGKRGVASEYWRREPTAVKEDG